MSRDIVEPGTNRLGVFEKKHPLPMFYRLDKNTTVEIFTVQNQCLFRTFMSSFNTQQSKSQDLKKVSVKRKEESSHGIQNLHSFCASDFSWSDFTVIDL